MCDCPTNGSCPACLPRNAVPFRKHPQKRRLPRPGGSGHCVKSGFQAMGLRAEFDVVVSAVCFGFSGIAFV